MTSFQGESGRASVSSPSAHVEDRFDHVLACGTTKLRASLAFHILQDDVFFDGFQCATFQFAP